MFFCFLYVFKVCLVLCNMNNECFCGIVFMVIIWLVLIKKCLNILR